MKGIDVMGYSDDFCILAISIRHAQEAVDELDRDLRKVFLRLSVKKTEFIWTFNEDVRNATLIVDGETIRPSTSLTVLGVVFNAKEFFSLSE